MNQGIEKSYPYLCALIGGAISLRLHFELPRTAANQALVEPILTNAITIGAILVGFLTGVLALLPGLDSPLIKAIRKTGFMKLLNSYLREGIFACAIFVIFSFMGFWVAEKHWFTWLWASFGVLAAASFFRITSVIFSIVEHHSPN